MTRPVLVIEHEADAGLDLMAGPFGSRLRVVRPYLGEQLPESGSTEDDGYAGLIVLGGAMGAWDDEIAPWLPATRKLMADAVQREVPTLGICLGGQLLAAACGGTVERGAAGLEVGLVSVDPLPAATDDEFFGRVQQAVAPAMDSAVESSKSWPMHQYHYDAVTRLPPDAELIVSADRYPVQGFRVGPAAWGVQYHPEVSTAGFVHWVEQARRQGDLTDAIADGVLAPIRAGGPAQQRVAAAHAQAFLQIVLAAREG